MDIISKINDSWKAGLETEIECDDGSKISIKDGVNYVFANSEPTNTDKDRNKNVAKNIETEKEIESL